MKKLVPLFLVLALTACKNEEEKKHAPVTGKEQAQNEAKKSLILPSVKWVKLDDEISENKNPARYDGWKKPLTTDVAQFRLNRKNANGTTIGYYVNYKYLGKDQGIAEGLGVAFSRETYFNSNTQVLDQTIRLTTGLEEEVLKIVYQDNGFRFQYSFGHDGLQEGYCARAGEWSRFDCGSYGVYESEQLGVWLFRDFKLKAMIDVNTPFLKHLLNRNPYLRTY